MWHPDALDTIDNYFGTSSRFTDSRESMWVTSITLSHWSLRESNSSAEHLERFEENRKKGDFPPNSVARLGFAGGGIRLMRPTHVMEKRSSSLVMTGDPAGNNWICSIWSSLTENKSIGTTIDLLPYVLQRFINQQVSGRCMAFLILLGHLCEKLANEYRNMLAKLDTIIELGVGYDMREIRSQLTWI